MVLLSEMASLAPAIPSSGGGISSSDKGGSRSSLSSRASTMRIFCAASAVGACAGGAGVSAAAGTAGAVVAARGRGGRLLGPRGSDREGDEKRERKNGRTGATKSARAPGERKLLPSVVSHSLSPDDASGNAGCRYVAGIVLHLNREDRIAAQNVKLTAPAPRNFVTARDDERRGGGLQIWGSTTHVIVLSLSREDWIA